MREAGGRKGGGEKSKYSRMLAARAQTRHLRVLELRETDPTLIHRGAHEGQLELQTSVPHRPASLHLHAAGRRYL